jgi:radical SAM protein with 4Fe4S-binding SPASM domain
VKAQVPTTLKYILTKQNAHEASRFEGFLNDVGVRGLVHIPRLFPRQDGDVRPWSCDLSDDEYSRLFQAGIMDRPRHRDRCYAGTSRIRISPDGTVFPCEFIPIRMGKLSEQPLEQILLAADHETRFTDPAVHSPRECQSCEVRSLCMRCPAMSYAESGCLTRPSRRACRVAWLAHRAPVALGSVEITGGR